MFNYSHQLRVRYAETDQMGVVYYGNYATYFEVTRVEAMRSIGIHYKALEEEGILMPVLDLHCKFIRPAKYDDLLTLKLSIENLPTTRILFAYETFNEEGTLLNVASTTLVFLDKKTQKPTQAPEVVIEQLRPYFVA